MMQQRLSITFFLAAICLLPAACVVPDANVGKPRSADISEARSTDKTALYAGALREFARSIGVVGYLYGAPLLELAAARNDQAMRLYKEGLAHDGVFWQVNDGRLSTHETDYFGIPNPDVLYASAWVALSNQPYVIYIPPMDELWYSVQFSDFYMNSVDYLSSRTIGQEGGYYLLTHNAWRHALPQGILGKVQVATPSAWILARVEADIGNQQEIAARHLSKIKLIPLSAYLRDPHQAEFFPVPQAARPPVLPKAEASLRGTLGAFSVINRELRIQGSPRKEQGLIALFNQAAFGPAHVFQPGKLPPPIAAGLSEAAEIGARLLDRLRLQPRNVGKNNWSHAPAHLGVYGDDYLLRGLAAYGGIGANIIEEALYPNANYDSLGRQLNGAHHYLLRFKPGELPPAKAFWSIAAYDVETRRLVDNPIKRYALGSKNKHMRYDKEGGLRIYLAADPPKKRSLHGNWLPVPRGPFVLVARIYYPERQALSGNYEMPAVVRIQRRAKAQMGKSQKP